MRIDNIFLWFKQQFCLHHFYTEDLNEGYTPPQMPEGLTIEEEYRHPAFTHRVRWACAKCGKQFHAHCGLDIVGGPKHKWVAYRRTSIQP